MGRIFSQRKLAEYTSPDKVNLDSNVNSARVNLRKLKIIWILMGSPSVPAREEGPEEAGLFAHSKGGRMNLPLLVREKRYHPNFSLHQLSKR